MFCFSVAPRNVSWEWILWAWWSRSSAVCLCWWLSWLQVYAPGEKLDLLIREKRNAQSKHLSETRAVRCKSPREGNCNGIALDEGIGIQGRNWVIGCSPRCNAVSGFTVCFSQGSFPLLMFFGILGSTTLSISILLWGTQRRKAKASWIT